MLVSRGRLRRLGMLSACALAVGVVTSGAAVGESMPSRAGIAVAVADSSASAATSRQQLVFQKGPFYVRWTPGSGIQPTRIRSVRDIPALGIAGAGHRIYWLRESRQHFLQMSIRRVSETGRARVVLVRRTHFGIDIAATRRFVFWGHGGAIGRVSVDGSHLHRRWLVIPPDGSGSVESGLATDGRFLYLSQCGRDRIGRVPIAAPPRRRQVEWIVRGARICPQDLAVAGGFIYWTALSGGGVIGRAPASGGTPQTRWTPTRTNPGNGPFSVEVAGRFVYWRWGGVGPGRQPFLGRVRADGSLFDRKFRKIGHAPITTIAP